MRKNTTLSASNAYSSAAARAADVFPIPVGAWATMCFPSAIDARASERNLSWPSLMLANGNRFLGCLGRLYCSASCSSRRENEGVRTSDGPLSLLHLLHKSLPFFGYINDLHFGQNMDIMMTQHLELYICLGNEQESYINIYNSWWDYGNSARERDVGWRLDYFFVNHGLLPKVKRAFILTDIMGSDHCPVGIEFDIYSGTLNLYNL